MYYLYVTINIPLLPAVLQTIGYYILEDKDSMIIEFYVKIVSKQLFTTEFWLLIHVQNVVATMAVAATLPAISAKSLA